MVIQFLLSTTLSRVRRVSMAGDSGFGVSSGVENSAMVAGGRGRGGGCGRGLDQIQGEDVDVKIRVNIIVLTVIETTYIR